MKGEEKEKKKGKERKRKEKKKVKYGKLLLYKSLGLAVLDFFKSCLGQFCFS